jgi:geranyl-CoA carboxylase alpha subunit
LRHPQFRDGAALIPFLEQSADQLRESLAQEEQAALVPAALAAIYGSGEAGADLPCPFPRSLRMRHRGQVLALQVRELADGALQVEQDGQTRPIKPPAGARVRLDSGAWHVQMGALDLVVEDASFQPAAGTGGAAGLNELRAPFNGKVIAIKARAGSAVARGETLLVIESMKLEHELAASRDGVVKAVHVERGQQAATSQVLVTFEAAA